MYHTYTKDSILSFLRSSIGDRPGGLASLLFTSFIHNVTSQQTVTEIAGEVKEQLESGTYEEEEKRREVRQRPKKIEKRRVFSEEWRVYVHRSNR